MNQTQNDAVMPSLFASLKSSESMPLASREDLERLITKDSMVSSLTMAYRKRMAISKSYADELKPLGPAISASLQYDGRGRSLDNVKAESIPVVFYIEMSNQQMANTVAEATGASTMLFHTCHNVTKAEFESGATYISLMENNLLALKSALN